MVPAQNRLKKKKDFDRAWKQGKSLKIDPLFIRIIKNELEISRFAFVVGLKVSKKAVIRNKLKRQLREIIRPRISKIKPGYDIIINALPGLEENNFQQIQETTEKLLSKARILGN
jgi:ribonuclease P protein component